ncbi:MAG: heterodisulfide reductase-related iron-sulfur binding cluster [Candidatus Methanomethylicia archaeon]
MLKYSLFLGCFIPAMQPFAEAAFRKISSILGIELIDIKGASCCPVSDVFGIVSYDAWVNIAARNMSLAEEINGDIVVLCNGCWDTFSSVLKKLVEDDNLLNKVNNNLSLLGRKFTGKLKVKHYFEVLVEDIGLEKVQENVKIPLNLNIAMQYGCKLYRDNRLLKYFDELIEVIGAKKVFYDAERLCCGYPLSLYSQDLAFSERTKRKIDSIIKAEVDCIAVTCPACFYYLEEGELNLIKSGYKCNIPILHLSELIALSFGFKPSEIGGSLHKIGYMNILGGR